jgi:hypothetical protein
MTEQSPDVERRYIITEKLVELIEGQLTNEYCRLCPHEGGGINSGIKAYIRSAPYDPDALKAEGSRKECVCFTCPDYGLADDCDPKCPTLKQHQAIAAKAREEVLDELAIKIREWPALEKGIDEEWRVGNIISSLRSEVKKE